MRNSAGHSIEDTCRLCHKQIELCECLRRPPTTKRIGEVNSVNDLAEGERAIPESDTVYYVRWHERAIVSNKTAVTHVICVDGELHAIDETGDEFLLRSDRWILVPRNKKREKANSKPRSKGIPKPH